MTARSSLDDNNNMRKTTRYNSQNVLGGLLICEECGTTYRRISKPSGKWFGNAECNQEDDYICITDMAKTKSGVSRTAGYSIGTDISKAQAGDIILT